MACISVHCVYTHIQLLYTYDAQHRILKRTKETFWLFDIYVYGFCYVYLFGLKNRFSFLCSFSGSSRVRWLYSLWPHCSGFIGNELLWLKSTLNDSRFFFKIQTITVVFLIILCKNIFRRDVYFRETMSTVSTFLWDFVFVRWNLSRNHYILSSIHSYE